MPEEIAGSSHGNSEPSEGVRPPRKRATRVKGKQGALKKVMDMPVDLIYEICTHLDVGELLALSNTNKNFRSILTGTSAPSLFKSARRRMGMPELLVPMPDLRYATLIFGKGCNICGKSNGGKIDPAFRARVCGACLKKDFMDPQYHDDRIIQLSNSLAHYCTKYQTFPKNGQNPLCYHGDLERISKELDTNFPITNSKVLDALSLWEEKSDKEKEKEEVVLDITISAEAISMTGSNLDLATSLHFRPELPVAPVGDFQIWLVGLDQERKLLQKDAQALHGWLQEMENKKTQANQELRLGRREDIERRFQALGFEKREFEVDEFCTHPQVRANRPLSDRTFATTVEPPLRKLLEEKRRIRHRYILRAQYEHIVEQHSEKEYFPPSSIYLELPVLEPVLNDVSRNPSKFHLLPESIKSSASQEIAKLIRTRREHLLRSVVIAYSELVQKEWEKIETEVMKLEEDSEETEQKDSTFTSINRLPFTLPRLPPWIPRDVKETILASDEQLVSFLENSPLARFECVKCRKVGGTRDILSHLSSPYDCSPISPFGEYVPAHVRKQWITIEGMDEVEKPRLRINADVLSLSLKLQQLVGAVPLVVEDASEQLPDLGADYSLGEEKADWFAVSLICNCCESGPTAFTNRAGEQMHQHLNKKRSCLRSGGVKATVSYSQKLIKHWRTLRDAKHLETNEFVEGPHDDSQVRRVIPVRSRASNRAGEGGGCVIM